MTPEDDPMPADADLPADAHEPHGPPRLEMLHSLELTPRRVQLRRLAAAGRDAIEHLVSTTATIEQLAAAADQLEDMARTLGELPKGKRYEGFSEAANAGDLSALEAAVGEEYASFDHSPFIGLANPLSPPIYFDYGPDWIRGRVTFGAAYEGPPGCVHGGYVAAAFDELLGATQSLSGTQGMTARLEVDYRSPSPLGQELTLLGEVQSVEGRKIWCTGRLLAGERLCAESRGLFISMDSERFRALIADRDSRLP